MKFSAQQISELLGGKVVGDPTTEVSGLSKIEEGTPGSLSFLANPAYEEHIYTTNASIVIVNQSFEAQKSLPDTCTLIRVANAYESFARLLEVYNQLKHDKSGIDANSSIAEGVSLGENIYLGPFVVISQGVRIGKNVKIYPNTFIGDNVKIGDDTIINAGCKILADCEIGNNCILHAGVVIGGDGFGFAPNTENNYNKVPQIGNVVLEDYVEIGANTTIDRATLGSTIIRKGVKIDNLVQIAHNVEIGENTVIAAQTGIAGSSKIGKNCMVGGQVGIVGHITIAEGSKIAAQSGIGSSIKKKNAIVQGSPAFEIGEYKRSYVGFKNINKLKDKVDLLEKELQSLKQHIEE